MCDLVELWTLSCRNFRVIHDLFFFSKYFKNIHDLDIFDYIYVSFRSCIESLRNIDYWTLDVPFSRSETFKNSFLLGFVAHGTKKKREKLFNYFISMRFFILLILFLL